MGYQPPKFQPFNGNGNPKQHVACFIETYNNACTKYDLLVKQNVWSLRENAFDWDIDLTPECINNYKNEIKLNMIFFLFSFHNPIPKIIKHNIFLSDKCFTKGLFGHVFHCLFLKTIFKLKKKTKIYRLVFYKNKGVWQAFLFIFLFF